MPQYRVRSFERSESQRLIWLGKWLSNATTTKSRILHFLTKTVYDTAYLCGFILTELNYFKASFESYNSNYPSSKTRFVWRISLIGPTWNIDQNAKCNKKFIKIGNLEHGRVPETQFSNTAVLPKIHPNYFIIWIELWRWLLALSLTI